MKLYNTLTRQIEEFVPNKENEVKLYTCGPTVYHYAHIGNLRNYIMEDILEKSLEFIGYTVDRAMNITDVGHLSSDSDSGEDKMLKGAKREKKSVLEIAKFYTDKFFEDCQKLNIRKPKKVIPATTCISEYISMIERLLELEYAYESNGNIYFDTTKLSDYYQLTNHKEDEMVVGVRESVEKDDSKKNQADFVLWFTKSKFDDQELKWDSPWGLGYPGWHIECSAIAIKYLGEYIDIHCGGVDNIFPHHTNEIAQSESYLGHKWCNYWVHNEHLNDSTGKMSKSKGEFLTVSLLEEKGYDPIVYRYFCLQSHYRKTLTFSYDALDISKNAYNKLKNKVLNIKPSDNEQIVQQKADELMNKFIYAINNDMNTSLMLTTLYDTIKADINSKTKIYLIEKFEKVLSLNLLEIKEEKIDENLLNTINKLIEQRNIAKKEKNFEKADEIRNELLNLNVVIKDTREGTIFELKKQS